MPFQYAPATEVSLNALMSPVECACGYPHGFRFHGIGRDAMDAYGAASQQKACAAAAAGKFDDEIVPITVTAGVYDKHRGLITREVTVSRDEGLRDGLVLEFERPEGAATAKLVVHGINTNLGLFAFEQMFRLRGDDLLTWYQRLERDPAERQRMISWMKREGMLHVKVWQDEAWVAQTALPDVGPRVRKSQVAVLDLSRVTGSTVRIQLESATDLWRIDSVELDYSPDLPIHVTEVSPASALDERGRDVARFLRASDGSYYVTTKGQHAVLTFDAPPARAGFERRHAVRAKGYYHPWFDAEGPGQSALADRILTEPLLGSRTFMPAWKTRRGL